MTVSTAVIADAGEIVLLALTADFLTQLYCLLQVRLIQRQLPDAQLDFVQPLQQKLAAEGVIDLLAFDEDDKMIIVDYKTGTPPEPDEVKLGYAYQLALYKDAAEKLYPGKKVVRAELLACVAAAPGANFSSATAKTASAL